MDENETDKTIDAGPTKHASRRLAHTASSLDSKELGDLGELAFVLAATARGLAVSKPFGDCRRYDLILDSGKRMLRIQVKSVYRKSGRGDYQISCSTRSGPNTHIYTSDQIDFIAVYLAPVDVWYLIPIAKLGTTKGIHLHPDGVRRKKKGGARFEIYREAWHQLDERALTRKCGADTPVL